MKLFSFKKTKKTSYDDEDHLKAEDEYVELNTEGEKGRSSRIIVRPFVMQDFSDIKPVLDVLREGYTIALVNIRPLKEKDLVELKRAVNKLKKTCDAIEGDIAGFGDDYIVITPSFASIYRSKATNPLKDTGGADDDADM
ncbi:cell division protein SepF [Candidatus Woesearchaeota archaeon]|nr:cell division protein SepF [Candidatus Woesearchaeota archaeon]